MIRERKRVVTVISLLFFIFILSFHNYAGEFQKGIMCGLNFPSYILKDSYYHYLSVGSAGSSTSPSFICGIVFSYIVHDLISFNTDLLYAVRRYNVKYENHVYGSGDYYSQLSKWDGFQELHYLEIPFYLRTTLSLFGKEICKPYAGLYYARLLSRLYEYSFSYEASNADGEITERYEKKVDDKLQYVKKEDAGFLIGVQVSLSTIYKPVYLDIRVTKSVNKINEKSVTGEVSNLSAICFIGIVL